MGEDFLEDVDEKNKVETRPFAGETVRFEGEKKKMTKARRLESPKARHSMTDGITEFFPFSFERNRLKRFDCQFPQKEKKTHKVW